MKYRNKYCSGTCKESEKPTYDTFDVLLHQSLAYVAGLWARLAEIAIRTAFAVLTSTAALLFEELSERIEDMAEKSISDPEFGHRKVTAEELNDWRRHYDLVCRLVEQINRSFGVVLLLMTGHDFATAIMDFNNVLYHIDVGNAWHREHVNNSIRPVANNINGLINDRTTKTRFHVFDPIFNVRHMYNSEGSLTSMVPEEVVFMKIDPIRTCQFLHPILRYLFILVVSNNLASKVVILFFIDSRSLISIFFQRQMEQENL